MKTIFTLLLAALAFMATAQPQKINYQGVAVGANGKPMKYSTVGLRLSVLDSLPTGSTLYTETQTASTDAAGQFSIFLGGGTATAGAFANLPWANGNDKFLKVEMDAQGGSNYQTMGTTQLVSVPYAMAAGSLREGTLLYGNNGQQFQLKIDSSGPKWNCYPSTSTAFSGSDQTNLIIPIPSLTGSSISTGESVIWSIISGNGGRIDSPNIQNTFFYRGIDSNYTLTYQIIGKCSTESDTLQLSFNNIIQNQSCLGKNTIDYQGESYPIVRIGQQCWFAKNLNSGSQIQVSNNQTNNGIAEKYCMNNDSQYCQTYGGLYQWAEAVNYQNGANNQTLASSTLPQKVQGICPSGWHIPSDSDWGELTNYIGLSGNGGFGGYEGMNGGALKSTSNWNAPNRGAVNSTGFNALAAGSSSQNGPWIGFGNLGYTTFFWTSTEYVPNYSIVRYLNYDNGDVRRNIYEKSWGHSIRCLKDTLCFTSNSSAGPDQLSLSGTTATLAANVPAAGESGAWSILAGSGGILNANNNPTATFTKGTDTAYTLVWTITGPCGTTTDTLNLLFPAPVGTACGQAVTYAGESYPTVQIGTQCWFAKNLNVGAMINSASTVDSQRNNGIIEKYCYNNHLANCDTFGGLYQWAEAVQYQNGASNTTSPTPAFTGNVQGICPTGWHLPDNNDWCILTTKLDGSVLCNKIGTTGIDVGSRLKLPNSNWTSDIGNNNLSGFSAISAGIRGSNGTFSNIGNYTYFQVSDNYSISSSYYWLLGYGMNEISRSYSSKINGFSIRCIKDCSLQPAYAGLDQTNLIGTIANLHATNPPSYHIGNWNIIAGNGGIVVNINDAKSSFVKGSDSSYILLWTISGPCGSYSDTVILTFPTSFGLSCNQIVDINGENYPTVLIGNQCWLGKNLNIGISINSSTDQGNNSIIEKYCYGNDTAKCTSLGGFYQWAEAIQYYNNSNNQNISTFPVSTLIKGICPNGWHISTDNDWCNLSKTIDSTIRFCNSYSWSGVNVGIKLKAITNLWGLNSSMYSNESGFSAIPAGYLQNLNGNKFWSGINSNAMFISSDDYRLSNNPPSVINRELYDSNVGIFRNANSKAGAGSVRCVKN